MHPAGETLPPLCAGASTAQRPRLIGPGERLRAPRAADIARTRPTLSALAPPPLLLPATFAVPKCPCAADKRSDSGWAGMVSRRPAKTLGVYGRSTPQAARSLPHACLPAAGMPVLAGESADFEEALHCDHVTAAVTLGA